MLMRTRPSGWVAVRVRQKPVGSLAFRVQLDAVVSLVPLRHKAQIPRAIVLWIEEGCPHTKERRCKQNPLAWLILCTNLSLASIEGIEIVAARPPRGLWP